MSDDESSSDCSCCSPLDSGLCEIKPGDEEAQALCDKVKEEFLKRAVVSASTFVAVSYRVQNVAGKFYFIKVLYGDDVYAHLTVYKPIAMSRREPSLQNYQMDRTKDDDIEEIF
ncbi:cystatin-A-like [Rana temporaria]|uniref:cystatin-A-like n=1 Tax=Rana temporaria TaxID=8407 RepID=UPI001AAC8C33|nr:cystatin-A-like [Rana temporaria]